MEPGPGTGRKGSQEPGSAGHQCPALFQSLEFVCGMVWCDMVWCGVVGGGTCLFLRQGLSNVALSGLDHTR